MRAAIQIQITDEPTSDISHRFRNFGEDVYRSLRDTCSVCIEEIDASTKSFTIRDIHRRDPGEVTQTIKRELK
jgi:phosphate uptake regulator